MALLRGLARRDRLSRAVGVAHERDGRPRAIARATRHVHARSNSAASSGKCCAVALEAPRPVGFGRRAPLARVPQLRGSSGNLERRMRPAERSRASPPPPRRRAARRARRACRPSTASPCRSPCCSRSASACRRARLPAIARVDRIDVVAVDARAPRASRRRAKRAGVSSVNQRSTWPSIEMPLSS